MVHVYQLSHPRLEQQLMDGEEMCDIPTSGHGVAIASVNSQQLWLLAHDSPVPGEVSSH